MHDLSNAHPSSVAEGAAPHQVMRLFQRDRMTVYAFAFLCTLIVRGLNDYPVRLAAIFPLAALVALSGWMLDRFFSFPRPRPVMAAAVAAWIVFDIAICSIGVALLGGARGNWHFWYLSIFASASFILGNRGIALVALGDTAGYLAALKFTGELAAPGAASDALERMALLHLSSWFLLRAVLALRDSRRMVRRLNEALAEKGRELEAAGNRLREASDQKSRFLASMSHELRTPLNAIIGFSEILEVKLRGTIPDRLHGFLGNIRGSGRHLHGLIDELLDLSKIEAGKMELHPEPLDAAALAGEAVDLMRGMAEGRSIELALECADGLPAVEADPVRMRQVLGNLLSNAIKYSPDGSKVTVRAQPGAAGGLRLEVCDQGVGIPLSEQAMVFEEFRQATTRSRATEGTGLGLPLAKRLVELHGGSLTLTSEVGRGTVFRVDLPARTTAGD